MNYESRSGELASLIQQFGFFLDATALAPREEQSNFISLYFVQHRSATPSTLHRNRLSQSQEALATPYVSLRAVEFVFVDRQTHMGHAKVATYNIAMREQTIILNAAVSRVVFTIYKYSEACQCLAHQHVVIVERFGASRTNM